MPIVVEFSMREAEFEEYCRKRGLDNKVTKYSVGVIQEFEGILAKGGKGLDSVAVDDVRAYVESLIAQRKNNQRRFLALARYFYVVRNNPTYVYLVSLIGSRGILPTLSKRVTSIAGEEVRTKVFDGIKEPPLGSPLKAYPEITQRVVERLEEELPPPICRKVLAGNMHRVPVSSFKEQRELFVKSKNIDEFLERLHERAVAELEEYMKAGKLWYEQEITPEVLEFVKENKELLAGVRVGNTIYLTKIPYSPKDYLKERDPLRRRYLACHCPLARESIIEGKPKISSTWCYCSAGFEKLLFDVVFEEVVEVELLESALAGDSRCRFALTIPDKIR